MPFHFISHLRPLPLHHLLLDRRHVPLLQVKVLHQLLLFEINHLRHTTLLEIDRWEPQYLNIVFQKYERGQLISITWVHFKEPGDLAEPICIDFNELKLGRGKSIGEPDPYGVSVQTCFTPVCSKN